MDWREKLSGLKGNLQAQEQTREDQKAAVLMGFRKRLSDLEPALRSAGEFGEAFGVDCEYEISRFDHRYPYLRFRIKRPALAYEVECRDGVLHERLKEGEGGPKAGETSLEALAPRRFEQRVTQWVQAAANANRKVPGRRT